MALLNKVENLDGVSESLHEHYKPVEGGGYSLDVSGMILEESVVGLKNSLNEVIANRDGLKKELNPFKEAGLTDPLKILQDLTDYQELKKIDPSKEADKLAAERTEIVIREKSQEFLTKLKSLEDESSGYKKKFEQSVLTNAISNAISKHDGISDLLAPMLKERVRFDGEKVTVLDNMGMIDRNNAGAEKTLEELIIEIKENETFHGAFKGMIKAGSGKNPASPGAHTGANGKIRIKNGDVATIAAHMADVKAGNVEFYY